MFKYKVQKGETPASLAARHKIPTSQLLAANPGVSEFATGMSVNIPGISSKSGGVGVAAPTPLPFKMVDSPFGKVKDYGTLTNPQPIRTGPGERAAFKLPSGQIVRLAPNSIFTPNQQSQAQPENILTKAWKLLTGQQDTAGSPVPSGVRGYNTNVHASPIRPGGGPILTDKSGGVVGAQAFTDPYQGEATFNPAIPPTPLNNPSNPANASPFLKESTKNMPGLGNNPVAPQNAVVQPHSETWYSSENLAIEVIGSIANGQMPDYIPSYVISYLQSKGVDLSQYYDASGNKLTGSETGAPPSAPVAPGTRARTANGGTTIQGENGQYAYISPYAHGQNWKVVTYKDDSGNWVRATLPDYGGGGRRGARPASTKGQNPGTGLVNFNAGTG